MASLESRCRQPEWMDHDGADPRQLARSLAFIRRINLLLGYRRATLAHLEGFSHRWPKGKTIHLIDLATGSADIPRAILRWADRRGLDVRIVAVDRHALTIRDAARGKCDPRLQIVQADVFNLPFAPGSFDYALTAMFLHHLEEDQIVGVLRIMDRLSRRGIIAADLLRSRNAYRWITVFTLCSNAMLKHDARISVAQALTKSEIIALRDQAGISYASYFPHFAHRFVLSGEKQSFDRR